MTDPAAPELPAAPDPAALRRARGLVLLAQCTGMLAHVFITNNHLLLYLRALGVAEAATLLLLGLLGVGQAAMVLPAALLCERLGRRRVGLPGTFLAAAGFAVLLVVPRAAGPLRELAVAAGALLHAAGNALHRAGWFALVDPLVEPAARGRFFGRMRFAFMATGILAALAAASALARDDSIGTWRTIVAVLVAALLVRAFVYARLPDLGPPPARRPWRDELRPLRGARAWWRLNARVFATTLASDGALALFALATIGPLQLPPAIAAHLGNATMAGMLVGFLAFGWATDHLPARVVLAAIHGLYAVSILGFAALLASGAPPLAALVALHALYGLARAGFSVEFTRSMLVLAPPASRSISTTITTSLATLGGALSVSLPALVLDSVSLPAVLAGLGLLSLLPWLAYRRVPAC